MTILGGVLIGFATLVGLFALAKLLGRCIDAMCDDDDTDG